jgi:hypothetical protein
MTLRIIGKLDTKSTIAVQMPKGEVPLLPIVLLILILLLLVPTNWEERDQEQDQELEQEQKGMNLPVVHT